MNFLKTKMSYLVLVWFIFCIVSVLSEGDDCNFGTCGECISFANENDGCVWCNQYPFEDRRCRSSSYIKSNPSWCKDQLYSPKPWKNTTQNDYFGEVRNGSTVQFRPQEIKMKVRPGVTMQFNMTFKPAKDYPLDVYYLMDTSDTMKDRIKELKDQALLIHTELSRYTNNVKLGIGSFVEKPGFPYYDPNKHNSHAFRNLVSLTENMKIFTSKVNEIRTGSNFDDPEASLDGLMQAMKCEKEIGWRKGARRIIILCTDSTYHSAGDGKIVGAIKPNDMQCHLEDNEYKKALEFDYPSVSQINKVARDENFRLIFAITNNNKTFKLSETAYKALAKEIYGARFAELKATNVLKIIKEAYEELANSILMKFEAPSNIEVKIDQDCASKPTRFCEVGHKESLTINGTVKVKSCPDDPNQKQQVVINPYGLPDRLTINLDVDCQCDCERIKTGTKASECNNAGFIQCGICKCFPGSHGANCRCNGTSTDQTDKEKCKLNKSDAKPCSGRGHCSCGICTNCQTGYSGDFCEFDDTSCPRQCSGNGRCTRGRCHCNSYWSGIDCSCYEKTDVCIAPYSKEICSGRGECKCGACICKEVEGKNETYSGAFCDSCEACAEGRCKELEDYAYCNFMHMNDKPYCDKKNNDTSHISVAFMSKADISGPKMLIAKWCKKELDSNNGSYMVFRYEYDNHDLKITIQKETEIPPEADIWVAVGSAIGLVLLIGILTVIIWKILVDLHDKREFKKFEDEALAAGYDVSQNPLYQDPSINFSNPVYNNQCN
ncbi:hypothetical protein B5X24_HaOG208038 [Helicoverpa armigera]|nr:hypothetical protein B5X24_HaOG208038 [Helicoverpa armigera]